LNQALIEASRRLASRALHALEHHPKQVTALIAAVLLGGGGGAFAVASLGPDASALPVREVIEAVQAQPVQPQLDALDLHAFNLYRSEVTRSTDSVDTLLARLGVSDFAATAFSSSPAAATDFFITSSCATMFTSAGTYTVPSVRTRGMNSLMSGIVWS
jgi:hypothetical protein